MLLFLPNGGNRSVCPPLQAGVRYRENRVLPASVKNRSPGGAAPPRYELWRGLGPRRDSEVANGVNRRLLWPLFLEAALQRLKLPFADESYAVTLLHGLAPGHYLARR